MKKALSLVLVWLALMTLAVPALAAPMSLEDVGVTLKVPEGMTAQDLSADDAYLIAITVDADASLKYAFSMNYIEEFEGKYIDDLTDEEGDQLLEGISAAITDPQYNTAETEEYKLLVVSSGDGTQLHYITLLDGWLLDVAVGRADGTVSEEDMQTATNLMLTLQFGEGEEAAE